MKMRFSMLVGAFYLTTAFYSQVNAASLPEGSKESGTQILLSTSANSLIDKPAIAFNYEKGVRLTQVISDGMSQLTAAMDANNAQINHSTDDIYWLGAALFDRQKQPSIIEEQERVSTLLRGLSLESEHKASITALERYVNEYLPGERQFIPIDYDLVRINRNLNPQLTGQYVLSLPIRPSTVTVVGAVNSMGQKPFVNRASAADYIALSLPHAAANNSMAWVIQPDGKVEEHTLAYWNAQHKDIAPGAIIYLGFSGLFSNYSELNEAVVALLRNKAL